MQNSNKRKTQLCSAKNFRRWKNIKFKQRGIAVSFNVEPACGERDIVVTTSVQCMCVHASVRICPGHNLYIYAWISNIIWHSSSPEEQERHMNHFLR